MADEKPPLCSTCGRKLTREEQSYRGLLFHDLRQIAARNLLCAGIREAEAKKIGGWKTTAVFHRYAIIEQRMMAEAMRKLERYRAEQAATRGENRIVFSLDIPFYRTRLKRS